MTDPVEQRRLPLRAGKAQDQAAARLAPPQGRERAAAAQGVKDQIADRMAVAGTGKAVAARPGGQGGFRGVSRKDPVQHLDRGGKACGGDHPLIS